MSRPQRLHRPPVGLQPGDVLLRCPQQPDRTQRGIARFQAKVYGEPHCRFVHVGLYVGRGEVVDATPAFGVACRPTGEFFDGAWVRVRRLKDVQNARRATMAREARVWASSGQVYSHLQAATAALAEMAEPAPGSIWEPVLRAIQRAGRPKGGSQQAFSSAYCGSLVNDLSARFAFRSIVDDRQCYAPLPAAFSANRAEYEDVVARW